MRRLTILFLTLLMVPLSLLAQSDKIHVESFNIDPTDLTANLDGTTVYDQNGSKCALIKVRTTEKGFKFDAGSIGVKAVDDNHTAEIWVYLPYGAKHLTISHPQLGTITYDFSTSIKKATTYIMKLTTDRVVTNVFDDTHHGRLILSIEPRNAEVNFNGSIEHISNGRFEKTLSFGTHRYIITADRYHQLEDTVVINSEEEPKVKDVKLKQAWGWLRFSNYFLLRGAKLYIDNEARGNITDRLFDVNSGQHEIKIADPLYETYEQEVVVKDSQVTYLSPELVANYGLLTLTVPDKNASIYIDGDLVGIGSYTDSVGSGQHVVECRRDKYRTTRKNIRVVTGQSANYELEAPTPIYASVNIKTEGYIPVRVRIDNGRFSDETSDFYDDKVIIGRHTVYVTQKGYRSQQFDIDLSEGENFERTLSMVSVVTVNFRSHPENVSLYVDNSYVGTTPLTQELQTGKHHILMTSPKHDSYEGDNDFKSDGMTFSKRLLRIYYSKNEFYVEGGAQAPSLTAWYGAVGFYASNVNIEGFYAGGFTKSDALSFNPSSSNDSYFTAKMKAKAFFGGKVGYGIKLGGRLRITPQVGCGVLQVAVDKNSIENIRTSGSRYYYSDEGISGYSDSDLEEATYAISVIGDVKFQFALVNGLSIVVTPSYSFNVNKNKLYEKLSDVSDDIKGWSDGFNISAGLNLYF